jgi:hypothetical protein
MADMPPIRRAALTVAVTLFAALVPAEAAAYERQWHAGASFGYAIVGQEEAYSGLGGGLHLTYGLTDAFNAMLETDFTLHPGGDLTVLSAALGPAYVLDILEWVPYGGILIGAYDIWRHSDCGGVDQPSCHAAHLGFSVPLGLDYQLSRSFAIGGQVRYHFLLAGEGDPSSYFTAFARAEFIWGF